MPIEYVQTACQSLDCAGDSLEAAENAGVGGLKPNGFCRTEMPRGAGEATQLWLPDYGYRRALFVAPGVPCIRRGLFKAGVPTEEHEIEAASRTVALLGDDQLGLGALFFRDIGLVEIRAVDE
jgi:hypothetical protein